MKNENLVEAFTKVAGREYQRLIQGDGKQRETAILLLKLTENAHLLDLEAFTQELHHEYINS